VNKVVLITGVAGGIGQATAQIFQDNHWYVIGVDQYHPSNQCPYVDRFIQVDVSQNQSWQQISTEVTDKEGHIDALVNNAAIQICKPLIETTPEEWDAVMGVNLRSIYLAVRYTYPLIKIVGGAIVNVSSVHAIATSANMAAYAASKGAILALTRALAIELADHRIRVNAVVPGAVDTPMLRAGLNRGHLQGQTINELLQQLDIKHVIGRIGQPAEIGQAIYFLADSHRSSFMIGQALVVDGGATAHLSTE
jgi:NAD(P)-dependent dehydrogenase (short-subunit alcohol dehydrogenase family)